MATTCYDQENRKSAYTVRTGGSRESKEISRQVIQRSATKSVHPNQNSSVDVSVNILAPLLETFNSLMSLAQRSYTIPDKETENLAFEWIVNFFLATTNLNSAWLEPLVTVSGFGDVVFEWWVGDKSLAVFVAANTIQFIQSWTEAGELIMRDAVVTPTEMPNRKLLLWLMS